MKENSINEEEKEMIKRIKEDCTYRELWLLRIIDKLQKEKEELKEAYKSEKKMKNEYVKLYQDLLLKENVISVQKVKDKIEELDIAILECEYSDDDDEEYKKAVEKDKVYLLNQKRALQELIKEREVK